MLFVLFVRSFICLFKREKGQWSSVGGEMGRIREGLRKRKSMIKIYYMKIFSVKK